MARDFVRHYSAAWETGKAMLVCIDKVTCVRMLGLIQRYWQERIEALEAERAQAADEQEAVFLRCRADWMRETRMAVVVSEEQGEVEKFRKWGLDVTPHRRLIKEGMDLPESLRGRPRFRNMRRMALDDAFRDGEHPFRIAVVCAMEIVAQYNREKDRVTIEQTFEALLKLVQALDREESRALREGLDEESLAVFDLLTKPDLGASDLRRIKKVAVGLLDTLKAGKLRVDQWRDKEATRGAVHVTIRDFLWSDETGLPAGGYSDEEVEARSDDVFRHVFRAYPTVPSPYYEVAAAA